MGVVAAVQQELSRFSQEVDGAIKKIRTELKDEAAARGELTDQVRSLADLVPEPTTALFRVVLLATLALPALREVRDTPTTRRLATAGGGLVVIAATVVAMLLAG